MFSYAVVGIYLLIGRKNDPAVTTGICATEASKEDEAKGMRHCNGQSISEAIFAHILILSLRSTRKHTVGFGQTARSSLIARSPSQACHVDTARFTTLLMAPFAC